MHLEQFERTVQRPLTRITKLFTGKVFISLSIKPLKSVENFTKY